MANRQKGEVRFEVDGTTYTLVLNMSVMMALEDHFSTTDKAVFWDEIWLRVMRGSVKTILALVWAMLQPHHPTMTIKATEALIDGAGGVGALVQIIRQAAESATPDPVDLKELGVPARPQMARNGRRGTGGASTSTRGASV